MDPHTDSDFEDDSFDAFLGLFDAPVNPFASAPPSRPRRSVFLPEEPSTMSFTLPSFAAPPRNPLINLDGRRPAPPPIQELPRELPSRISSVFPALSTSSEPILSMAPSITRGLREARDYLKVVAPQPMSKPSREKRKRQEPAPEEPSPKEPAPEDLVIEEPARQQPAPSIALPVKPAAPKQQVIDLTSDDSSIVIPKPPPKDRFVSAQARILELEKQLEDRESIIETLMDSNVSKDARISELEKRKDQILRDVQDKVPIFVLSEPLKEEIAQKSQRIESILDGNKNVAKRFKVWTEIHERTLKALANSEQRVAAMEKVFYQVIGKSVLDQQVPIKMFKENAKRLRDDLQLVSDINEEPEFLEKMSFPVGPRNYDPAVAKAVLDQNDYAIYHEMDILSKE